MFFGKNNTNLESHHLSFLQGHSNNPKSSILVYKTKEQMFELISSEDFPTHFQSKLITKIQFDRKEDLAWIISKTEKILAKPEVRKKNDWTRALYEKDISKDLSSHIYLKWINPLIGYGIFAKKNLPPLQFAGEYLGLVKKRAKRKDKFNNFIFGYPLAHKDTHLVIDALNYGGLTRFINHSDEPNLTSTWIIVDGIPRVIFFTNKAIAKDTQLTYDYGPYYWKKRTPPFLL